MNKKLLMAGALVVALLGLAAGPALANSSAIRLGLGPRAGLNHAALATGLDPQTLLSSLREGKSLKQVAKDLGMTEESLLNNLLSVKARALESLLEDGKIDESTAGVLRESLSERIRSCVERIGERNGICNGNGHKLRHRENKGHSCKGW